MCSLPLINWDGGMKTKTSKNQNTDTKLNYNLLQKSKLVVNGPIMYTSGLILNNTTKTTNKN